MQLLVKKVRFEAFKRGLLKTYGVWMPTGDVNTFFLEDLREVGREALVIEAGTPAQRRYKAYAHYMKSSGMYHLFTTDKDVKLFPEDIYMKYDLSLMLNYGSADGANRVWYLDRVHEGNCDPIYEMGCDDEQPSIMNPFYRHLGLSLLPYIPKHWEDAYSLNLARELLMIAYEVDSSVTEDLMELLSMPASRVCFMGMSYVKNKLFWTTTDSTAYFQFKLTEFGREV